MKNHEKDRERIIRNRVRVANKIKKLFNVAKIDKMSKSATLNGQPKSFRGFCPEFRGTMFLGVVSR